MLTPLFELYNVFASENEKERTNVWQTKVRSFVAGIAGFEPANAGVKVLCLNRLGYIPVCLCVCMSIQQSGRFVKSGFACAVRRIRPPRCGIAAYRRAAKPTESAASPGDVFAMARRRGPAWGPLLCSVRRREASRK